MSACTLKTPESADSWPAWAESPTTVSALAVHIYVETAPSSVHKWTDVFIRFEDQSSRFPQSSEAAVTVSLDRCVGPDRLLPADSASQSFSPSHFTDLLLFDFMTQKCLSKHIWAAAVTRHHLYSLSSGSWLGQKSLSGGGFPDYVFMTAKQKPTR